MAVVLRQVLVEFLQIQTAIDGSKKMGRRNDVFKVESVEQSLLPARLMTHHVGALRTRWRFANSARRPRRPRVFQQNLPIAVNGGKRFAMTAHESEVALRRPRPHVVMPQVQGRLPSRGTEWCGGTAGAQFENECSVFFPLMVNFLLFACRLTCSSECVHQTVVFRTR